MPTASLRAPEGYHLPNAMTNSQSKYGSSRGGELLFDKFGGHPCAAGFGIDTSKLEIAKELMGREIELQSTDIASSNDSYSKLQVPTELQSLTFRKEIIWLGSLDITKELLSEILALDPFGQDFALPNLGFEVDFWDFKSVKWLGQDQKHFKIPLPNGINLTFFGISPELKEFAHTNKPKEKLWVVAKPIQNAWRNSVNIELIVDKSWVVG
jgi:RecJ OB domain